MIRQTLDPGSVTSNMLDERVTVSRSFLRGRRQVEGVSFVGDASGTDAYRSG